MDSDTLMKSDMYELFNRNENLICNTNHKYLVENME